MKKKIKISITEREFWKLEELKARFRVLTLSDVFRNLGVDIESESELSAVETRTYNIIKEKPVSTKDLSKRLNLSRGRISQILHGRGKHAGLLAKRKIKIENISDRGMRMKFIYSISGD